MIQRLIIQGGTVVSTEAEIRADVIVEGERIAALTQAAQPTPEDTVIAAGGCYVLPGVIDAHTHIKLDTGIYRTADDWFTGTRAAAFGGVTTVIDFATQFPGQTFREAMDARRAEAESAAIDYALHVMVTDLPPGDEHKLGELVEMGAPSFKLYTTYRPNYYADDATILRILRASVEVGGLVMVHCENDDLVTAATQALVKRGDTGWRFHAQARPALAEQEAVARVLFLAEAANAPLYVVHCSTARSVELVRQARQRGQAAYCETCPQYLLLDERVYAGSNPEHFILQPPLRAEGEGAALWERVAGGAVDVISTDHCDYSLAQKRAKDDFTVTPGGLPGLETLLPLVYTYGCGAARGRLTMPALARMLSANPARIFGLYPQKGAILPGADADLVIYDPAAAGTVRASALHYIAQYNPYEGMPVRGAVRATISRGKVIFQAGEDDCTPGHGRYAPRRLNYNR
ncbi:MAG: dihydropyrimidinase [Anaerolineae bacterium]|nr:dihydropyrimidinase [Anaerolineae bacterium]